MHADWGWGCCCLAALHVRDAVGRHVAINGWEIIFTKNRPVKRNSGIVRSSTTSCPRNDRHLAATITGIRQYPSANGSACGKFNAIAQESRTQPPSWWLFCFPIRFQACLRRQACCRPMFYRSPRQYQASAFFGASIPGVPSTEVCLERKK